MWLKSKVPGCQQYLAGNIRGLFFMELIVPVLVVSKPFILGFPTASLGNIAYSIGNLLLQASPCSGWLYHDRENKLKLEFSGPLSTEHVGSVAPASCSQCAQQPCAAASHGLILSYHGLVRLSVGLFFGLFVDLSVCLSVGSFLGLFVGSFVSLSVSLPC